MNKITSRALYFLSGIANGLFGSGGGILTVEALTRKGIKQKNAQATSLAVTVLMSLISVIYYSFKGYFKLNDAVVYLPFGIPGALFGSYLLNKLPNSLIRKLFALLIITASMRMLLK